MITDKIYYYAKKYAEDNKSLLSSLSGKTVLVTGAAGLIGSTVVHLLATSNLENGYDIGIIASDLRDPMDTFTEYSNMNWFKAIEGDITKPIIVPYKVDYIVHCAAPTASKFFVEHPTEVINVSYEGTRQMLQLAIEKEVAGMVYVSSMEVYGLGEKGKKLKEKDVGYVDPTAVRNCYPEAKRLCENMCCAFEKEFGVPASVIRLAQTFGPGISKNDNRLFAYLLRNVLAGKDIQLATPGNSERMCLFSFDAATAILSVLINGERGKAYNAANESTYCSVLSMAEFVNCHFGNGNTKILLPDENADASIYPADHYLYLDVSAIQTLGWSAKTDLLEMFQSIC